MLAPGAITEEDTDSFGAVPLLGEHSDRIWREFGRKRTATGI
jgi:hypothetical protein